MKKQLVNVILQIKQESLFFSEPGGLTPLALMEKITYCVYLPKLTFISHLTRKQRHTICTMLQNGYPQSEITGVINKKNQ